MLLSISTSVEDATEEGRLDVEGLTAVELDAASFFLAAVEDVFAGLDRDPGDLAPTLSVSGPGVIITLLSPETKTMMINYSGSTRQANSKYVLCLDPLAGSFGGTFLPWTEPVVGAEAEEVGEDDV